MAHILSNTSKGRTVERPRATRVHVLHQHRSDCCFLSDPLPCFILQDKTCSTGPGLVSFFRNSGQVQVNGERSTFWVKELKECAVIRTVAISETCSQRCRDMDELNGRIRLFKRHKASRCKHKRCRHSRYCFQADTSIRRGIKSILARTDNIMKSIHILY